MIKFQLLVILVFYLILSACNEKPSMKNEGSKQTTPLNEQANTSVSEQASKQHIRPKKNAQGAEEIDWDDLIPKGFSPDDIMKKYDIEDLSDDDPRAEAILESIQTELNNAPVVETLNGKMVKIPGYMVPLDTEVEEVSSFLLVPYFGACIHVPPPPLNQTVYIDAKDSPIKISPMYDAVWVTGKIKTEKINSELASAGYKIEAVKVEAYE